MFHASAAADTLQGRAIQKMNNTWGSHHRVHRTGYGDDGKSIGIPVCKKKYRPFEFHLKKRRNNDGRVEITVERMYGCGLHSDVRKSTIIKHGERKGWEKFGQWSLSKAKAAAKREAARLNNDIVASVSNNNNNNRSCCSPSCSDSSSGYDSTSSSSEGTDSSSCVNNRKDTGGATERQQQSWQTLCHDGMCNWKVRGKVDDICLEIEEERA
eukprot:scaffold133326_cov31-Cyclotella_meneghiniana.AAC.3